MAVSFTLFWLNCCFPNTPCSCLFAGRDSGGKHAAPPSPRPLYTPRRRAATSLSPLHGAAAIDAEPSASGAAPSAAGEGAAAGAEVEAAAAAAERAATHRALIDFAQRLEAAARSPGALRLRESIDASVDSHGTARESAGALSLQDNTDVSGSSAGSSGAAADGSSALLRLVDSAAAETGGPGSGRAAAAPPALESSFSAGAAGSVGAAGFDNGRFLDSSAGSVGSRVGRFLDSSAKLSGLEGGPSVGGCSAAGRVVSYGGAAAAAAAAGAAGVAGAAANVHALGETAAAGGPAAAGEAAAAGSPPEAAVPQSSALEIAPPTSYAAGVAAAGEPAAPHSSALDIAASSFSAAGEAAAARVRRAWRAAQPAVGPSPHGALALLLTLLLGCSAGVQALSGSLADAFDGALHGLVAGEAERLRAAALHSAAALPAPGQEGAAQEGAAQGVTHDEAALQAQPSDLQDAAALQAPAPDAAAAQRVQREKATIAQAAPPGAPLGGLPAEPRASAAADAAHGGASQQRPWQPEEGERVAAGAVESAVNDGEDAAAAGGERAGSSAGNDAELEVVAKALLGSGEQSDETAPLAPVAVPQLPREATAELPGGGEGVAAISAPAAAKQRQRAAAVQLPKSGGDDAIACAVADSGTPRRSAKNISM